MILDTSTFFYDESVDDFEIQNYFFKFGQWQNDLYLTCEEFSFAPLYEEKMFLCCQEELEEMQLRNIAAVINPKYDKIGVYGKIKFLDNQLGRTMKFLHEVKPLRIRPYGHGEVIEHQIKNFILMGFVYVGL